MDSIVDGPLLAVSDAGGAVDHLSLRQVLLEAPELADVVVDLPTQRPALLRQLLLPVVVDALGRPRDLAEWAQWFSAGAWTPEQAEKLSAYLDEHSRLFRLFDPVDPFGQVAGLATAKKETKGSGLIVATEATGNNVPLFAARSEAGVFPLTPAQALRWLLHTHCWDTAAIKTGAVGDPQVKAGKTTGNPTGPLGQLGVTLPAGRTLYETLLLNIPVGPPLRSDDRPQWRRRDLSGRVAETGSVATAAWEQRAPKGLLELWTWQSRRIRLVPEETGEGPRVTRVVVAAGDRMPHTPEIETHAMWRLEATGAASRRRPAAGRAATAPKADAPPRRPLRMQPGKAAWRGLDALLAPERTDGEPDPRHAGFATSRVLDQARAARFHLGDAYRLRVELTGISYGTQSSVVEDVLFDALPLPVAALTEQSTVHAALLEAAEQAEQLAGAVNYLSADLRRSQGAEPIPWDKGQRPGEQLLHALDPLFRRLLHGLRGAGDDFDAVERWLEAWERLARERALDGADLLLRAVPLTAFAGRKETSADGTRVRTYRASTAEAAFRDRLVQVLPRAAKARVAGHDEDKDQDDFTGDDDE